jgi:ribosomal-protein-alanine N-acetyltransferase
VVGRVSIAIRDARDSDLGNLVRLENEAFAGDQLDRRAFRHALRSATIDMLVAEEAGEMLGYVQIQRRTGSDLARLTSVAVAGAAGGRGLGAMLVAAAEALAHRRGCGRMRLEVRADNVRARRLYERTGYALFTTVPEYYEDGEAALRFEKTLAAPSR